MRSRVLIGRSLWLWVGLAILVLLPLQATAGPLGLTLRDGGGGATVTAVAPGSSAAGAGLEEGDVITLQDIFLYDHSAGFDREGRYRGTLKATGLRPKFLEKMSHSNVTVDPMLFATERS